MDKILIYSQIGNTGILAKSVIEQLDAAKEDEVEIWINSIGGSVFDGMAIYNVIKNRDGKTKAYIEGIAYGMAAIIALACDEIHMKKNAYFVLSEVITYTLEGKLDESQKKMLEKPNSTIAEIYMIKPKKTKDEILEMMRQETWLTDAEALRDGFVDFIYE